jgi:RNA polymerase sigma-70 factor (ECF subfamily)
MQDETALLEAVGRGDERALEDLYDSFSTRLYGFGLRLLGQPGLAEELVQETFVRIWQQASRFDPRKGNARTFVFTVARRLAVDLWRRPSSRPLELAREETTSNHVEQVVTSVVVREALQTLSEDHRTVLELLHFQQFSQSEAAVSLDIPLGTVKTRAYHAVRALRKALEERGVHA